MKPPCRTNRIEKGARKVAIINLRAFETVQNNEQPLTPYDRSLYGNVSQT